MGKQLREWMKVALITDTHAGSRNDNQAFNEFFIKFFEEQFFPYLKENNIRRVVHLGDVFDRRKYINFKTLSSWHRRVFMPLYMMTDCVDFIVGNHDTYYKNTNDISSTHNVLSGAYEHFNIYSCPEEATLGDLKVLYMPWICDDTYEESFELLDSTDAKICLGHLEIKGFEMHAGRINHDKGISRDLFDKFYMTLSGHFHHKSTQSGIHYLGSPYPMMWSDWGDSRGFHVLDTETMDLEYIENPKQIFHKLYYNDSKETYRSLFGQDISALENKYVKVIVQQKKNPYWFDQFIEKLYTVNPHDVSVEEGTVTDFSDGEDVEESKDTLTILLDYVKSLALDAYEEEAMELMRELYIEAINSNSNIQDS